MVYSRDNAVCSTNRNSIERRSQDPGLKAKFPVCVLVGGGLVDGVPLHNVLLLLFLFLLLLLLLLLLLDYITRCTLILNFEKKKKKLKWELNV